MESFVADVVRPRGVKSTMTRTQSCTRFMADTFLPCSVGNSDLVYDQERRMLIWLAETGERVGVQFTVRSGFRVNVSDWRRLPRMIDVRDVNEC